MKKHKSAIGTAALLLAAGMLTVSLPGCSPAQPSVASPSDFASSEADVAENRADASDAVSVMVEGQQDTEVFLLSYNWYGEEFVSKDSLNKLMMENYAPEGAVFLVCGNGGIADGHETDAVCQYRQGKLRHSL